MTMHEIGRIKQVQVQRASLKAGERPYRYYDPTPLLVVDGLLLSPSGVVGLSAGGEQVIDVHNADHPASKNQRGINGISIGFTSHYQAMRERFGPHLTDGIAGENILVAADRAFALADVGARLAIQTAGGAVLYLADLLVAAPCVEFSQFAASQAERLPPEALKATLQFLDDGRRGFYASLAGEPAEAIVRAGDRVFVDIRAANRREGVA
ncbi:MAG: MOSC domain-containing protein [Roseiflexaceae bacterium]